MKSTSPEAVLFDGPKNPELPASIVTPRNEEQAQMLADMRVADPSIGMGELPDSPVSGEDLATSMEDMLAAMSPEARENMEDILQDVGSIPVAEVVELDLPPVAVAGTDQLEALANDPAQHSNEDGTITTEVSPRRLSTEEIADINTSLETFSPPSAESPAELVGAAEKPLSGRRVLDIEKPVAESSEDQDTLDKLTTGKLTNIGTRMTGMKDLRAARKEIISKQRESMKEVTLEARGDVWHARGRRVANWKQNNFAKRIGQRSDRRSELRDMAFDAIEQKDISNPRKSLMRLQARKNAWKIARQDVRKRTQETFEAAEKDVLDAKNELRRQKNRGKSVRFSPVRRRTTMGGAGSAGFMETWGDSAADIRKKQEVRKAEQAKRIAALKARQAKKTAVKTARES
jgi:hypothetical protein